MKYSEVLNKAIEKSGLSLTDICEMVQLSGQKLTNSYLSKLRNGKMPPPSYGISVSLAKALDVKPEILLAAGVNESKESDKKELETALNAAYPDEEYGNIYERAAAIIVDPKMVMEDQVRYQFELTDEEVEKMLEKAPPNIDFDYVESGSVLNVPILGTIPAGEPARAKSNIEEYINIPNMWNLNNEDVFVLRVKGDSMIGSRIYEGDLVVVKMQCDVETGEIAVVNVNGEDATLKRVKKTDTGQVVLYPDNPKYEPIIINNANARILGKVIHVMFEPKRF